MNFNENIHENLDKLLNDKRMILLIPGVIITVIAVVLLVMAVAGGGQEPFSQEQALIETKESIMSELVQAKEYLSQLEEVITDNWKVLTQDNFSQEHKEYNETALVSQYESFQEKLLLINEEINEHIENNENLDGETKRILLSIINSLAESKDEMGTIYEKYLESLVILRENHEIFGENHKISEIELKKLFEIMMQETTDINDNLTGSINEIKGFLNKVNIQYQILRNEDMDALNKIFANLSDSANEDMGIIIQLFTELAETADGDMETINRLFSEMAEMSNGDMEKINRLFIELAEIANGDMETINQLFSDLADMFNIDIEKTNQLFIELTDVINEDISMLNRALISLTELVNYDINNIQETIEAESIKLHSLFFEKLSLLTVDLASLKLQIDVAKNEVSHALKMMDIAYDSHQNEISESFFDLNKTLFEIQASYIRTHEEVKNTYLEFKDSSDDRHGELLDTLKLMSERMEFDINGSMESLLDSINKLSKLNLESIESMNAVMQESFKESLSESLKESVEIINNMNQDSISNIGITINNQISELNNDISDKMAEVIEDVNSKNGSSTADLSKQIDGYDKLVREKLDNVSELVLKFEASANQRFSDVEMKVWGMENILADIFFNNIDKKINLLDSQLKDVFQSVANGKKILAATLAAKGQPVAFDEGEKSYPTFNKLAEAIMDIETIIMIENIPGVIEYERHFHKGDGFEYPPDEAPPAILSISAGCHNAPMRHEHEGGLDWGCYHFTVHIHNENCSYTIQQYYSQYCPNCGGGRIANSSRCENCGRTGSSWPETGPHTRLIYNCNGMPLNSNSQINCGMNETDIIGYSPSCGYLHGQITRAIIIYPGNGP